MKCPYCGSEGGNPGGSCPQCGGQIPAQAAPSSQAAPQAGSKYPPAVEVPAKENMVLGIVGALVGSLIGAVSIVLLGQLGYIASISGWLLAILTLKGYEKLGKKLSVVGVIICIVVMVGMTFAGYVVSNTVMLMREYEATWSEAYPLVMEVIGEGHSDVNKEILMLYAFVALGAVPTIISFFKNKK